MPMALKDVGKLGTYLIWRRGAEKRFNFASRIFKLFAIRF